MGLSQAEAVENSRIFLERERAVKGQACPLTEDFFAVLKLMAKKDVQGAALKLFESNPLAAITARCAPEIYNGTEVYNRQAQRVSLRAIERFCADRMKGDPDNEKDPFSRRKPKVAVIGSGPAGLMASAFLSRQGFAVTVVDSESFEGGSCASCYPEFRLPRRVVDQILGRLRSQGVEFKLNTLFPQTLSVENLFDEGGFSAVLLATGAGITEPLGIPEENAAGVMPAAHMLLWTRAMRAGQGAHTTPLFLGKKVVVAGQNEMAFDAARTAIRLGKSVELVIAGAESDVRVPADFVRLAAEEGVKFRTFAVPESIRTDASGCVKALACRHLDYRVDSAGRLTVAAENSAFEVEADTVINARAMRANTLFLSAVPGLDFNLDGSVWVKPDSSFTSVRKIFAAGHVVRPGASLLDVLVDARRAAFEITAYLNG